MSSDIGDNELKSNASANSHDADGYFAVYVEYSKNVRTWFVAYGVGGPVLFITQAELGKRLAESGWARAVVILFCLGVALQIVLSLINKWCQWNLYRGEISERRRASWQYDFWVRVSNMVAIDVVCDVGSLIAFAAATVIVISVFIPC